MKWIEEIKRYLLQLLHPKSVIATFPPSTGTTMDAFLATNVFYRY